MASNYPPGVTGREPQIAGPFFEGLREMECHTPDVELHIIDTRLRYALQQRNTTLDMMRRGERLQSWNWDLDRADRTIAELVGKGHIFDTYIVAECPFEGEVEVIRYSEHAPLEWVCPVCDTEHEEEDY